MVGVSRLNAVPAPGQVDAQQAAAPQPPQNAADGFAKAAPRPIAGGLASSPLPPASGIVATAEKSPEIALNPWRDATDVGFIREVVYYQRAARILWYRNAGHGAWIGALAGTLAAEVPAIILAALSAGAFAALLPAGTVAGALTGAGIAAAGRFRCGSARPDDVRQHIFSEFGIVETRKDSEKLMAQLKDAGVLRRTRHRSIIDIGPAAAVFAQAGLDANQQQRACRMLEIIATETNRRAALQVNNARVMTELESIRSTPVPKRTGMQTQRLKALSEQVETYQQALDWMPELPEPEGAIAAA